MKTMKQKLTLLFCAILLLALAIPFYGRGMKATAATKKSSLEKKTVTAEYGNSADAALITIKNWNPKAKYSVSVSPKNAAKVINFYGNEDQNQAGIYLTASKKVNAKVTVKETVNNKTRKVGTCTVKFTTPVSLKLYLWDDNLSLQRGQTYNLYPLLGYASKSGIKFSIADKTIATVNKYGVISAKKAGSTTLAVRQGSERYRIALTVTEKTNTSSQNKKLNQLKEKTEALYNKKITASNYTSWHNQYYDLTQEWAKYSDYSDRLQVSGKYTISDCRQKLVDYMKTRTKNSSYGASLDAVKITKLTSNKVTLQLAKPVSKADMVNLLAYSGKYSKNAKAGYSIVLSRTDSKYNYTYVFKADVKEGQKTITGKLMHAGKFPKNPTPDSKTYTLKKADKGKTYTYSIKTGQNSSTGFTFQRRTIKCS